MKDRIATREEQVAEARARGDHLQAMALENSKRLDLDTLDLSKVPFSNVPTHGYNHCQQVSMLAFEIGQAMGLSPFDLVCVKMAGLLHDCARTQPWQIPEPGHQRASAELAVRTLRARIDGHGNSAQIDRVEQLILAMDLSAVELPRDPAMQVLWDVDALESARLAPKTDEGQRVWRARTAADRLCTQFAKERERKLQMLRYHGWGV